MFEGELETDEGRIPGASSVGYADDYVIHGFQFAYCANLTVTSDADFVWYEDYAPCTDPVLSGATPVGSVALTGLPNGGCWIVTIDMSDSAAEFSITGDGGDSIWDMDPSLDSFGYQMRLDNDQTQTINAGFIIAGDYSGYGDGTKFINPGATAGTGLDAQDPLLSELALRQPGLLLVRGSSRHGSHYMVMTGTKTPPPDDFGSKYGTLTANSVGPGAEIYCQNDHQFPNGDGMLNPPGPVGPEFHLSAGLVPHQPGVFFFGTAAINQPFGCGFRLVGGSVVRLPVSLPDVDGYARADVPISLLPQPPSLPVSYFFQYWYRDPAGSSCGGFSFNLSRALVTVWR